MSLLKQFLYAAEIIDWNRQHMAWRRIALKNGGLTNSWRTMVYNSPLRFHVTNTPIAFVGAEFATSCTSLKLKLDRNDEELLQKAIVYEAEHGFPNCMGRTKRFSEFLRSKLSALSLPDILEADTMLTAISNAINDYDNMDREARVSLIDKVCKILGFECVQDLLDQNNALAEASKELQTNLDALESESSSSTRQINILRSCAHPAIVFGYSDPVELYRPIDTEVCVETYSSSNICEDTDNQNVDSVLQLFSKQTQVDVKSGSRIQKTEFGKRLINQVKRTRKAAKPVRPSKSYESWLLNKPISLVSSLSPYMSSRLDENGFYTLRKLLQHYPRTYINFLQAGQIVEDGQYLTFFGKVISSRIHNTSSLGIVEVLISSLRDYSSSPELKPPNGDGIVKGTLILHIKRFFRGARYASKWFLNKVASKYPLGAYAAISGKVKAMDQENHFEVKDFNLELVSSQEELAINERKEKIYPVYSSKGSLDAKVIETCIQKVLADLPFDIDPLPEKYKMEYGLMDLHQAYIAIHCPPTLATAEKARQRFVFDEFFYLQVGLLLQKQILADKHLAAAGVEDLSMQNEVDTLPMEKWAPLTLRMLSSLSYKLTDSQLKSVSEIMWDLQRPVPMRRLLQGDVGCGKTIVAFLALLEVVDAGFQGALMVPTEFLAKQQYKRFSAFLEHLSEKNRPQLALLSSSVSSVKARAVRKGLLSGDIHLVVGTHSLISESVKFSSLRLVVIDEQHRFGVEQRIRLQNKGSLVFSQDASPDSGEEKEVNSTLTASRTPHVLAMTATPIPRTLAFALYGDMALSQITELPPGRTPVKTYAMLSDDEGLHVAFKMIHKELESGGRVFIVYPIIDESEELPNLKAATSDFSRIVDEFDGYNCGLVHGKLKPNEKEQAMDAFKSGQTQVLVATTVIEVGIDIVEASMMVIMHAERYGMAQLHQLRGRVGRGMRKSTCLLLTPSQLALQRVKVLEQCNDGFHLAEVDLQLRGPGDLLGKQQSGHLPEFSLARFDEDGDLMVQARRAAEEIIAEHHGLEGLPRLKQELSFRQGLDSLGV